MAQDGVGWDNSESIARAVAITDLCFEVVQRFVGRRSDPDPESGRFPPLLARNIIALRIVGDLIGVTREGTPGPALIPSTVPTLDDHSRVVEELDHLYRLRVSGGALLKCRSVAVNSQQSTRPPIKRLEPVFRVNLSVASAFASLSASCV
jgi:hypothetical protein